MVPGAPISIYQWLAKQMLHGKDSRARTRFLKLIEERAKELDAARLEMLDRHAEHEGEGDDRKIIYLDKDGKDTTDKGQGVKYKILKMEDFDKEWAAYLEEKYVIDVTPAVIETIYGVRNILLNTPEEFSDFQATVYDEWCQAFESISKVSEDVEDPTPRV